MSETPTRRRHQHSKRRGASLSLPRFELRQLAALSVFPASLCVAHLSAGANNPQASLWLTAWMALVLTLAVSLRSTFSKVLTRPALLALSVLFGVSVLVAVWTLIGVETRPNAVLGDMDLPRTLSIDRSATLIEILKLAGLGAAFLIGCIQGQTVRRALITAHALVFATTIYALIGFVIYFTGGQVRSGPRLTAGFLSANSTATLLGTILVIAVGLLIHHAIRSGSKPHRRNGPLFGGLAACVAVLGTALVMTTSRTGLTATAITLMVLAIWAALSNRRRIRFSRSGWTTIASLAGLAALAAGTILWERSDTLGEDGVTRAVIFASHWQAFLASPVFGYGLGSFVTVNNVVMDPDNYASLWAIRAAHNVYIQWLEEAGLLGALPMFACIAACIGLSLADARRTAQGQAAVLGLIVSSLVVLIHGLTDYALQVPSIAAAWAFILGLQFAFSRAAMIAPKTPSHRRSRS
jgi:O-antigen ligase